MNCRHALQRLLATSGPRRLPDEVRAHLDECGRCRDLGERLRLIDDAVAHLPVPDSAAAKAALMRHFLSPPAAAPEPVWAPRRLRVNWVRALAATAAVVLLVLAAAGVFNLEKRPPARPPHDALLARVIDRQVGLARADSVEKRVEVLDRLAGDLDGETLNLAYVADKDDLAALADMYVSVVSGEHGLVSQAELLPQLDRQKRLEPIADRLKKVSDEAARKAGEAPPDAVAPLKKIAATARDAQGAIRRKINEEKMAQDGSPRTGESKS